MSNKTEVYAVRILTGKPTMTDSELGIYAGADGNTELRWSGAPLVGVDEQWTSGMIAPDGIGVFVQRADLRRGGGSAVIDETTVVIDNTSQAYLKLEELGIYLDGLSVIIYEFTGTVTDSDSVSVETVFTGTVENVTWNERAFTIRINSSMSRKRKTNIGHPTIPVTFGESDPENDVYFKFAKVLSVEDILNQADIGTGAGEIRPGEMDLFPVVGTFAVMLNNEEIRSGAYIRLGYMDGVALTDSMIQSLTGKYVLCKEGPGDAVGKYRKIYDADRYGSGDEVEVAIQFSDYWPVQLVGNYDGTAEDQTWVQFVDIQQQFDGELWQCGGFYDGDGNELTNAAEIYSKNSEDEIVRLPAYGSDVDVSNPLKNSLVVDPKHFNNGIENLNGYLILPVENFGLYTEPDLSAWNTAEEQWWEDYYIHKGIAGDIHGLYNKNDGVMVLSAATEFSDPQNVIDRDRTTSCFFRVDGAGGLTSEYVKAFKFDLPIVPSGFGFDKAYLGISLIDNYNQNAQNKRVRVLKRGYINRVKNIVDEIPLSISEEVTIKNVPDFYYLSDPSTANKDFYVSSEPEPSGKYELYTGFQNFLISESLEDYNAIQECLIAILVEDFEPFHDDTHIYQLCVIFENAVSFKEVYL